MPRNPWIILRTNQCQLATPTAKLCRDYFPGFQPSSVWMARSVIPLGRNISGTRIPQQYFEMYIAEQNMVGAALGLARRGKIPFVSTFAAFFSRAFDQIRMGQYSDANLKFVGSHAGVSIGEDGPSQMGLEDLAMFRTILNSVVFYPADAVATERLVERGGSASRHCLYQNHPGGHSHPLQPGRRIFRGRL